MRPLNIKITIETLASQWCLHLDMTMQKWLEQWTVPTTWMAGAAIALSPTVAYVPAAYGQVVSVDDSRVVSADDGTGTTVSQQGNRFDITGGTQTDANLFHKFESLNIEDNQTVNFLPDPNVLNIVGQVSGPDPSYIEGQLQVQASSNANLYLVNPQGVLFGPDAKLSLSGSFAAVTADQVGFGDTWLDVLQAGSDYTALTAAPSAFRFTADAASAVVNQGELSVAAGKSLTLMGGHVVSEGRLEAPSGEIGLIAVSGESTVQLGLPGGLLSLEIAEKDFGASVGSPLSPTDLPALLTGESGVGVEAIATDLLVDSSGGVILSGTSIDFEEVAVTGVVSASAERADGGTIALVGRSVDVLSATVEASGRSGGTIRIGNDSMSESLPASELVLLRNNPVIRAQGQQRAGGDIVINANNTSIEEGTLSVQGETQGGMVEISATRNIKVVDGTVEASGQLGNGRWLLNSPGVFITDDASASRRIDPSAIENALDAGTNVEIDTVGRNLALSSTINQTGDSQASLTLRARRLLNNNSSTISLASTGQLAFDIEPINNLGGRSVRAAIASIGSISTTPLLRLGAATYELFNTIDINSDINIVGAPTGGTIFSASGNSRLLDISSEATVALKDLTFTTSDSLLDSDLGGGIDNSGILSIDSVIFEGNRGVLGGALNNKPESVLTVTNSEFINNRTDSAGGAINADNSTVNIFNSTFDGNSAAVGGAIRVAQNSVLTVSGDMVSGSTFKDNTAVLDGGAIAHLNSSILTVSNTDFTGNSSQNNGGAIKLTSAKEPVSITDSTFTGNTTIDDGGAVHIQDTTATLSKVTFTGNISTDDGGAAAIRGSGQTTFNQAEFKGNGADSGGAVTAWDGANIVFAESTFNGNIAQTSGGAFSVNNGTYQLNSATLEGNMAGTSGGGISSYLSSFVIDKSTIDSNIANIIGGGLTVIGGESTVITQSDFLDNEAIAEDGGAIYVTDGAALKIMGGTFVGNNAGDQGGAVFYSLSSGAPGNTLGVDGATFIGNEAASDGGAIAHNSSQGILNIHNSSFTGNTSQEDGGGVFLGRASSTTATGSTLAGNFAENGGAVANIGTLSAANVTISGNQASDEGGGIWTAGETASLLLTNATLTNNNAELLGGGIRSSETQLTQLLNTIVAENQSAIAADVSGRFVDEGNNLIGQSNGSTGFNRSFLVGAATNPLDPGLNPLAENGGTSKTHLLQADSSAINAGASNQQGNRLTTIDQRGSARVVGAAVDIGAVEVTDIEIPNELLDTVSPNQPAFVIAAVPIPSLAALPATALDSALLAISQFSTLPTEGTEDQNLPLAPIEVKERSDDIAIRKIERAFSQSYQDYWNLPIGDDPSFQQVQAVLRRAQDEYQVNSAVVYAAFTPRDASIEVRADILSSAAAGADDDVLQLLLVTPNGELKTHRLPVTRADANRQVRLLRSNVSDPEDAFGHRPLTQQLYQWLLAPLEEDLAAQGIQNLLYSLDKGLRTAPITAMRDANGYALERYGISVVSAVGLTQTDFPARVRRSTVAMGVAEFDTQAPLPAVPIELDFVEDFIPASKTILNEDTTLAALKAVQTLEQPGVLHLATHADFDSRSPESSSIHLWQNPLSMAEFKALDWASADLEMLILSACVTALSSPNSELGFAGLAAAAGVDATVGSLWQVSDTGTLALMSEFYIQLENTDLRFEALRRAQLSLLNGETRIQNGNLLTSRGEIDLPDEWNLPKHATLDHPFFWSAFTMVGNPW